MTDKTIRLAVLDDYQHVAMQSEDGRRSILSANDSLVRNGALSKVVDSGFFAA